MSGRGGARHFTKPVVDTDVLYSCLEKHQAMVSNLGQYDHISRSQGVDAKGLVNLIPLWKDLLRLCPCGEIHPQPMRQALLSLLSEHPDLNTGRHSGQVWVNLKVERLNCLLAHVRKLGGPSANMAPVAAKLCREDYNSLLAALKFLEKNSEPLGKGKGAPLQDKPLEKVQEGQPLQGILKRKGPVEKATTQPSCLGKDRRLKQESSDVSLDAHGFPTMFASPDLSNKAGGAKALEKAEEATGRPGQRLVAGQSLKEAMGFLPCKAKAKPKALGKAKAKGNGKAKALEKATAKAKALGKAVAKKPATGSLEKEERKHWVKIRKTCAKNPERAYLCGTTIAGSSKLHLIVEVSATRCPQYSQVIDDIWTALEKGAITKQEAKDLKEKLCSQHGC